MIIVWTGRADGGARGGLTGRDALWLMAAEQGWVNSAEEIETELATVPGWTRNGDQLHRTFVFEDFVNAFGFMASSALVAMFSISERDRPASARRMASSALPARAAA